jgi:hypothetical protein
LLNALNSESWDKRRPAALALANASVPKAHARLSRLLTFDHGEMELNSAHSRAVLSSRREYARTAAVLADRDLGRFNLRIAWSLSGTTDAEALKILLEVLRGGNGELRVAAAHSIRASIGSRDLFDRMLRGEFGEPPDLGDAVESLVVPLWPDCVVWPDGATSSIDEVSSISV